MKRWVVASAVVVATAIVFAVGLAVGEAIHDNPKPGITLTVETTIHP